MDKKRNKGNTVKKRGGKGKGGKTNGIGTVLVLHGNAARESSGKQRRYGGRRRLHREVQRRLEIDIAADAAGFVAGIDQEFLLKAPNQDWGFLSGKS